MNISIKIAAAAAMIGSLAMAAPASALTTGVLSCGSFTGPTELGATLNCAKFNTGLGTLTSMTLAISGQISGTIRLQNNGAATQTGRGTTSSDFSVGALAGFSFADPFASLSFNTGNQTLAAGGVFNSALLTSLLGTASQTILSGFAPYQQAGAGTFGVTGSTLSGLAITGGGGNFAASNTTTGTFAAEVTYNYDAPVTVPTGVPEPASMALLGVGMLVLGAARRRRG